MKKDDAFKHYLLLYTCFVAVGMIIIGMIMLTVAKQCYINEIEDHYAMLTKDIANSLHLANTTDNDVLNESLNRDILIYDTEAVVFDESGTVIMATPGANGYVGKQMDIDEIKKAAEEDIFSSDDCDGFFPERMCSYICKYIDIDTPKYVMMFGECDGIRQFNQTLYLVYFSSAFILLVMFSIFAARILKKIIRPLDDIIDAARQYSRGDFSTRVNVKGDGEIGKLARVMNEMADSIDKNERNRLAFIANVSHELRTPMTSIGGFVDAILSGTISENEERHYLKIVSEEIKRLSRLVRSMLNLSKYESKEMVISCSEFELSDLIIKTLFMFEEQINSKKADVKGLDFEKMTIIADKDLIQQVIFNLTENAVKFVDEGGVISYNVKKSGKFIEIAIRNTGEGIAPEDIPRIFEKFFKTDASRGKDKTGVGLGLSIVRSIIALHKGSIHVSSEPGKYTQFDIKLPIDCSSSANH